MRRPPPATACLCLSCACCRDDEPLSLRGARLRVQDITRQLELLKLPGQTHTYVEHPLTIASQTDPAVSLAITRSIKAAAVMQVDSEGRRTSTKRLYLDSSMLHQHLRSIRDGRASAFASERAAEVTVFVLSLNTPHPLFVVRHDLLPQPLKILTLQRRTCTIKPCPCPTWSSPCRVRFAAVVWSHFYFFSCQILCRRALVFAMPLSSILFVHCMQPPLILIAGLDRHWESHVYCGKTGVSWDLQQPSAAILSAILQQLSGISSRTAQTRASSAVAATGADESMNHDWALSIGLDPTLTLTSATGNISQFTVDAYMRSHVMLMLRAAAELTMQAMVSLAPKIAQMGVYNRDLYDPPSGTLSSCSLLQCCFILFDAV